MLSATFGQILFIYTYTQIYTRIYIFKSMWMGYVNDTVTNSMDRQCQWVSKNNQY